METSDRLSSYALLPEAHGLDLCVYDSELSPWNICDDMND